MLQRFAPLLFLLGILVMGFGGLMLVPLTLSWVIDDGAHSAYDEAVLITVLTGALLAQLGRRHRRELRVRDSFLLVVLVWSLCELLRIGHA